MVVKCHYKMMRCRFHYLALSCIAATSSLYGIESQALSKKEILNNGGASLTLSFAPATNMSIISTVNLPACTAVSQPHTHPRSAELNIAQKGVKPFHLPVDA